MMNIFTQGGTASALLILSLVIATGLYLGRFKIKGISLGTTWILFVGIILSHYGLRIEPTILSFIKDFGLILFVFAIGLQVGPGFFSSFKKEGLSMNLLAVGLVVLAVVTAFVIHKITGVEMPIMTGIMSGAVTNTPGLGAAQQTLSDATIASGGSLQEATNAVSGIASAYAVAYPLGVLGAIFLLILCKSIFKIDLAKEKKASTSDDDESNLLRVSYKVENPAIFGKKLETIIEANNIGEHLVLSRVMRGEDLYSPESDFVFQEGDKVLIVTNAQHKEMAEIIFGAEYPFDMKEWVRNNSNLISRRLSVTKSSITGKSLKDLNIRKKFGVSVTRILRAGLEIQASPDLILQVGDSIKVVGTEEGIHQLAKMIGNKPESLSKPNLIPIFFGIAIGVIVGITPIYFPSMPQPLKLGLAGGSLIVAILLSYFGPKLRITTYTELSANLMIREIGISLFMAAVGIGAGENFIDSLVGGGYLWILYGLIITVVPMLIIALVARLIFKMDFFKICGLLAGGTTDPALLSFSEQIYGGGRIAVNYATVYPLTMFLRVVAAQLLIMLFV